MAWIHPTARVATDAARILAQIPPDTRQGAKTLAAAEGVGIGIRSILPNLRWNCFILMGLGVDKVQEAEDIARTQLRAEITRAHLGCEALADTAEPFMVETLSASWGYPERIIVTW